MVPSPDVLPPAMPDARIRADGRPTPEFRAELRRVRSWRNALSIASTYAQAGLVIYAAVHFGPWAWLPAVLLMGRTHAQLAALMHDASHRMLFTNKALNDWTGRWLLGYPGWTPTDAYRRSHAAHHREEFGPDEPDLALYRGYPLTRASFRRKLWRDARGSTGWKLIKPLLAGVRSPNRARRRTTIEILAVQAVLFAAAIASGHWWVYPLLWVLPYMTVWRVINRLRAIAEHGGLGPSPDRRATTHSVRQHWVARFALVPYNIGFHLAHHVDSGIPFRSLPRFHRALRDAGYITDAYEYPSYRMLWRALRSG